MAVPTVRLFSPQGELVIVNECDAIDYVTRQRFSTTRPQGGTYQRTGAAQGVASEPQTDSKTPAKS